MTNEAQTNASRIAHQLADLLEEAADHASTLRNDAMPHADQLAVALEVSDALLPEARQRVRQLIAALDAAGGDA